MQVSQQLYGINECFPLTYALDKVFGGKQNSKYILVRLHFIQNLLLNVSSNDDHEPAQLHTTHQTPHTSHKIHRQSQQQQQPPPNNHTTTTTSTHRQSQ
jgi:hypothetical protein